MAEGAVLGATAVVVGDRLVGDVSTGVDAAVDQAGTVGARSPRLGSADEVDAVRALGRRGDLDGGLVEHVEAEALLARRERRHLRAAQAAAGRVGVDRLHALGGLEGCRDL